MALKKSTVKTPLGMRLSYFYPIKEEPAAARPVYDAKLDMGTAVKGYLTVTTASGSLPGDDIAQLEIDKFVSGQLDAETTMSDLEVNARIYGHRISETEGEISHADDVSPSGGYGFVEPFMTKDKSTFFRATALLKVTAVQSSEKQEADTKKPGEIAFKNYAVSYKVSQCATGEWRLRNDFETQAEALAYLEKIFDQAAAAAAADAGAQQNS